MEDTPEITLEAPARVPAWTWLVVTLALAAAYALTLENGAVLQAGGATLHELFHDGRHLLGVPCH
jgi:hypothetical protein